MTAALEPGTGFVYVLTNTAMPGQVKIGMTAAELPEGRADQLFTTGIPTPFDVAFRAMTSRCAAVESRAHEILKQYRVNQRREFFSTSVEMAVEAVKVSMLEVAGIASWASQATHAICSGDRLALTLQAGQIFVLITYPNIFAPPEVTDLWQVISDGDLLEIFGTDSGAKIVAVADGIPESVFDPVPQLNKTNTAPNRTLIGLERLVPGERLLWCPGPNESSSQQSAIFEAQTSCQVLCRTWRAITDADGMPVILNSFTYDNPWPAAVKSIRDGLALPIPRVLAPRSNRGENWEPLGSTPAKPEHWVSKLGPNTRKTKNNSKFRPNS